MKEHVTTSASVRHYDAVVVGARVAGASTAMLLARAGLKVLVIDRQAYGSDRLSTHALMRGAVMLLDHWGVLPRIMAAGTPPVTQTSFIYDGDAVTIDILPEGGAAGLIAPRRTVLDRILVDAALVAGAEVRHGVNLKDLVTGRGGRVVGCVLADEKGEPEVVSADLVIGADGRQSAVGRMAGAPIYREGRNATACVYGYFSGLENAGFEWYFAPGAAAGAIPTNDGMHCVFAAVGAAEFAATFRPDIEAGFSAVARANSPRLAEQIAGASRSDRLRGFGGFPGYLRKSHGPGWALVGDAGYFKDPLTAHGITDALRDAQLLANAVLRGGDAALADYQARRDAMASELFEVTEAIAGCQWDMDTVRALHHRLSRTMKAECEILAEELRGHRNLAA